MVAAVAIQEASCSVCGPQGLCRRNVRAGEVLARQGTVLPHLCWVREGTVALRAMDGDGRSTLVDLIHPGSSVGFHAALTGERLPYSIEGLGGAVVCLVPRETVRERIRREPALHDTLTRHMAEQVNRLIQRQVLLATMSVSERMATLLLELRDNFGEADGGGRITIRLPLSRQDMAAFMNTVPETISRTIRELEVRNVAHFEGRVVTVPDLDALMDAAGRS